jgi:hypothetical protein
MELQTLPNKSLLLRLGDVNILIDCPLDLSSLTSTAPISLVTPTEPIKFDTKFLEHIEIDTLDIILISNCTALSALPYLATHFKGKVFMTDPTSRLGRSMCEELISYDREYRRKLRSNSTLYTLDDIRDIWNSTSQINYHQIIRYKELNIAAISSGHSLGSANWIIEWGDMSIGVVSASCDNGERYPAKLNSEIWRCKTLIFSPVHSPSIVSFLGKTFYHEFIEACRSLSYTGSIFIPIDAWQLLDLEGHVLSAASVFNLPVLCMAPSARAIFSHAAGSTEWLSDELRRKAFIPTNCFSFEVAKEKEKLFVFNDLREGFGNKLNYPCIILISHSSLRLGEADYILNHLCGQRNGPHILLTVDKRFNSLEALEPFRSRDLAQNLIIKNLEYEIGLRLEEIVTSLSNSSCGHIIIPESFQTSLSHDFLISSRCTFYSHTQKLNCPHIKPHRFPLLISPLDPGYYQGRISCKDYKYMGKFASRVSKAKQVLSSLGFSVTIRRYHSKDVLIIPGASLTFKGRKTKIYSNNEELRKILIASIA